ncbi:DUF5956 family protein [Lentzea sp. NPDC051208]|uniref:DUF5956 family protein n=1 Tax=Lentzea sp. NPDC051208 TaxID=3154642 RepID=UPI00341AC53A
MPEVSSDVAVTSVAGRPDSAHLEVDGAVYGRVPDTGLSMLIAWLVGPKNLARLPDCELHTVAVTTVQDGTATRTSEPRGQVDQDMIDDGVDEYLTGAQVPSPPRGYRWYQRVPEGYSTLDDAYAYINGALRESDPENKAARPAQLVPLVAEAVAGLYPS